MSASTSPSASRIRTPSRTVALPTPDLNPEPSTSTSVIDTTVSKATQPVRGGPVNQPPQFDGEHLWIHHDAQHLKAKPHRKLVFSHVQRRYRPWKRRRDSKALRDSVNLPVWRNEDEEQQQRQRTASPTTVLAMGNSDPFNVYPVTVGPQENELIGFYRDMFLPAQYGMKLRIPNLDQLLKRDWEDCMNGFLDKGIAHASLARWGQMVARVSPRLYKTAIEHQHRSTQILREKIAGAKTLQTFDNYLHINQLYSAETIGRNLAGAMVHGRMLRIMFEEAWSRGILNYKLLLWQVHNDIQTSTMFLVRPIFDVDRFLPMVYAPVCQAAAREMPPVDPVDYENIDPSIEGPLTDIFKSTRRFWALCIVLEAEGKNKSASNALMTWGNNSHELIDIGRFVNHYLNVKERIFHEPAEALKMELLVQEYLAAAAAYLTKSLNLNPVVLGKPMFDMRPSLIPALRGALEESEGLSTEEHRQKYVNARLWALYVGALSEQSLPERDSDPHTQWFNAQLAKHATAMGLYSWPDVKIILRCFLYNDRIAPDGSLWFEKTMEANRKASLDL